MFVYTIQMQIDYLMKTCQDFDLTLPVYFSLKKLLPIDELFLFLTYLSTSCTQTELGHRFNSQPNHCDLGQLPLQPTGLGLYMDVSCSCEGQSSMWLSWPLQWYTSCPWLHRATMPNSFIPAPSEWSLIQLQVPLHLQAMVDMSPHGAMTFVSSLFEGSMSDREVFCQSGITSL